MAGVTKISGYKNNEDWKKLSKRMKEGKSVCWKKDILPFFEERLKTRYLTPIENILELGKNAGEGFSIVTIQCSLIEFLETTYTGYNYDPRVKCRYLKCKCDKDCFTYGNGNSRSIFIEFLTKKEPFKGMYVGVKTKGANSKEIDLSEDFYSSVRCSLLHEARTKNYWKIRKAKVDDRPSVYINGDEKIIYRDKFQKDLKLYVDRYCCELLKPENKKLREAFIRKFNALCEE